ncbi:PREDICTED: protein FAR1-RELATED SEQUENCE 5-like [Ipomoea nil]|uniref:protein FAR1-RELATED SEQUENCE 5-like n=1 Tax=Ipomoea nil TaxID=35883 RepID=UPI0009015D15|nr:PREDICTED: protein FAR1-RELATED SEQUENCE 5-like [Ipomoea nil]
MDPVGFVYDKDTSIDAGVEGSGGVCNTEHSTDGGHIDGCVEGSGSQCDEGNSTDVAVETSGQGASEHCLTDVEAEDNACVLETSPGLTKYWRPVCTDSLKPMVGQTFDSLDCAIVFYKQYAGYVGFDCRKGTIRRRRDGVVVERQVFCSREGFKQSIYSTQSTCVGDGKPIVVKRRRVTNRVGCKARVVFKRKSNGLFVVHFLEERHTHVMCSIIAKQFLKVNRSLDTGHQMFIASCVRANIGYVRSYKLFKEIFGEYSNVGATGVDFKNFKRDLMAYILNGDAQLFIDTLFKRRELCEAFEFEYDVDDVDQLTRVFWADAVSRKNFALFGDVVLFDATYRSNRYNLVFVPFTGIDNHKRSITFGAGLLTREDVDSYVWLLERFKKTMRHEPICVVTDQDPAVKIAVARVFGTSKHRFCMWHIMCKVGEKVGPVLAKDEVFRRKLNGIVWNKSIDSKTFEDLWSRIIEEYGLGDNGWFRYLFESHTFWASPYFHDEFMSGFVRTTSRSESQNSFFGSFSNGHSSLVEFLVHFDSAISAQRHAQAKLTADSESCFPVLKTPLALEKHAMDVYTISVFYDVQVEICEGCFSCRVVSLCECEGKVCYGIKDGDKKAWSVEFLLADCSAICSCKMFERMGLVCRHIFFVFKDHGLERIPSMYLVSRWTKGASLKPIFDIDDTVVDQSAKVDNVRVLTNLMWSEIYASVGLADGNVERLEKLRRGSTVEVRDPIKAKNKGGGKRMKSAREKAVNKCVKQSRKCHTCDEYGHNSRTCPLNG